MVRKDGRPVRGTQVMRGDLKLSFYGPRVFWRASSSSCEEHGAQRRTQKGSNSELALEWKEMG